MRGFLRKHLWEGKGLLHHLQANVLDRSFYMFLSAKHIFLSKESLGGGEEDSKGDPLSQKHQQTPLQRQPRSVCVTAVHPWPNHLLKRQEAKCHKDRRRSSLLLFFLRGEQTEINGCSGFPPRHIYGPVKHKRLPSTGRSHTWGLFQGPLNTAAKNNFPHAKFPPKKPQSCKLQTASAPSISGETDLLCQ